jgi:uncharacterized protein
MHNQYQPRTYRDNVIPDNLVSFSAAFKETDLFICADYDLSEAVGNIIINLRSDIEQYISDNPGFQGSLEPVSRDETAPAVVKDMINASRTCDVGPMAAVAGAVAEATGRRLLRYSSQVIVENGGDIFISSKIGRVVGIYTGPASVFGDKLSILISPEDTPCGICTSSATVGHSLSLGKADAVVVLSPSASVADACATALCNRVKTPSDIKGVMEYGKSIKDIKGILIAIKGRLGLWGDIRLS